MYLRFQGQQRNERSSSKLGIFQLAFELRDRDDLPTYVQDELQLHLSWLKKNLHSPDILDEDHNFRAICWFKSRAKAPLTHIWAIKAILDEFGYPIDVIKSRDPGPIIYEDGWQIVARPRKSRSSRRGPQDRSTPRGQ